MIMFGLCLAMMAACFDGTIVGTVGTVLAADLGGLDLYAWMATAYMLCETIMIPIAGKLSDLYGRKNIFLIGLGIFTVGSFLAGMSTTMEFFIACRAIQGLGGGTLIPVVTAAIADLYSPRERARMQGILGAIFGVGNGIGPLVGGYIEGALTWHWCFYINIPLAVIAFVLTLKKFPAPISDKEVSIDVRGISFLSLFLLDLILLIEFGGDKFEWVSPVTAVMVILAVVLLAVFVRIEHRAIEPVLAPHLIRNRTVVMGCVFMLVFGIGMLGAMMYSNMFAISVFGLSALEAGEWSLAIVIGMMITSLSSGFLVNRTGYRPWLITGPILCFVGLWYLSQMVVDPDMLLNGTVVSTYQIHYMSGIFVLGLGLGCMMSVINSAIQNSAKPTEMGMTMSSVNLLRTVGATMGTAIFSMIINSKLAGELLTWAPDVYDMWPDARNTGVLNYLGTFTPEQSANVLTAFANSVDFAFLTGGTVLLMLVIIGILFKVKVPGKDEAFEEAKRRIEEGEHRSNTVFPEKSGKTIFSRP